VAAPCLPLRGGRCSAESKEAGTGSETRPPSSRALRGLALRCLLLRRFEGHSSTRSKSDMKTTRGPRRAPRVLDPLLASLSLSTWSQTRGQRAALPAAALGPGAPRSPSPARERRLSIVCPAAVTVAPLPASQPCGRSAGAVAAAGSRDGAGPRDGMGRARARRRRAQLQQMLNAEARAAREIIHSSYIHFIHPFRESVSELLSHDRDRQLHPRAPSRPITAEIGLQPSTDDELGGVAGGG